MRPKRAAIALCTAMIIPIMTACNEDHKDQDSIRTLRVATTSYFGSGESYFREQYFELFEFAHDDIRIELVSSAEASGGGDPVQTLINMMTGDNPPDLVMIDYDELPELVRSNTLEPLDPRIKKDNYDMSDVVPVVTESIRTIGDGVLYAFAPSFSSPALYYNKNIFAKAGVTPPTDGMTWDQVFDLAKRVSSGEGNERIYGFGFSPYAGTDLYYNLINLYTPPLQLPIWDDKQEAMMVNTKSWEEVWKKAVELDKSRIYPPEGADDGTMSGSPASFNFFAAGRMAMTISNDYLLNELIHGGRGTGANAAISQSDWDVVTVPSHPDHPGVAGLISLNGLMGINAKAANPGDAWELLKFVNGEQWAKIKSRGGGTLVSRGKALAQSSGSAYNIAAFYKVVPPPVQLNRTDWTTPYLNGIHEIGRSELRHVLEGKSDVKSALKQWQIEGDVLLQQHKSQP